jgi:Xaa-Pro dipeptidase
VSLLVRRTTFPNRLEKLKRVASANNLDGVILVPGPNLRYFTGVSSFLLERTFLFFVPREGQAHLVAPTLESGPYLKAPIEIAVLSWNDGEGPRGALETAVQQLGVHGRWGVEGRAPYQYTSQLLTVVQPQLENAEPILQQIRAEKDEQEIRLLQRASSILAKSFLKIPAMMKPGMSELELARKISEQIQLGGAESVPDVLVQSGPMAADGHHQAGARRIRRNESVIVDATCTFSGYYADITRTFIMGKDPAFENLYETVLAAQKAAIISSEKGVTVGCIDNAARSYLQRKGLGEYFVHRTGHGLGLEVHEAPYIIPGGSEVVQESMVFTIEPGVYFRNKTGIRIEDDLLVTQQGRKILTNAVPKNFGWWR